ncbi:tyrosine recombinase XerC [Plantactinospora solaniradicis]|uniref:Tyrosine recombinase XerC n=1 Tax=Plantactinospora solaniradicis TaxID=1723736 RepID=A0ABW1KAB0_9ACTN
MKGSIKRYCTCTDPDTGRQLSPNCPALKSDSKHGSWAYRDRLPTTDGVKPKPFQRRGFATKTAAGKFRSDVYALLDLARGDTATENRLGDFVFEKTKRGGQLPTVEDVKRRLGIGTQLDRSSTVAELLEQWYAVKKRAKRDSTLHTWRGHLDNWLLPFLGEFPAERLSALHITDLFDMIDEWNAEIVKAEQEGRAPVLPGDRRPRPRNCGVATQRRIFATLRNAYNWAMKAKPVRLVDFNPCDGVEMPGEYRDPELTWDPEQVGTFLEGTTDDPLHDLYRLVLLHGPRRGEAVGARWAGYDHPTRILRVIRPLVQVGGRLVESRPKSRAGERVLFLDEGTSDGIRSLRPQQARNRLLLGEAYEDNDLIWCREDGTPYSPEYVSRHFKDLARGLGLPVIKLHGGRHTAATLRLEAGTDIRVVSEQMGHSKTGITRDLYQHVRRAVLDKATDAVIELLPKQQRRRKATG